jgi:hypothetical protein
VLLVPVRLGCDEDEGRRGGFETLYVPVLPCWLLRSCVSTAHRHALGIPTLSVYLCVCVCVWQGSK